MFVLICSLVEENIQRVATPPQSECNGNMQKWFSCCSEGVLNRKGLPLDFYYTAALHSSCFYSLTLTDWTEEINHIKEGFKARESQSQTYQLRNCHGPIVVQRGLSTAWVGCFELLKTHFVLAFLLLQQPVAQNYECVQTFYQWEPMRTSFQLVKFFRFLRVFNSLSCR